MAVPRTRQGPAGLCYSHRMGRNPFRNQLHDEDSSRWAGFPFRQGDIVISTRPKTGTTWVQMICALLIFQRPELPAPLWHLSPWLDHSIVPREVALARLGAQRHRRFIKTHTPLDGITLDPRATFIVTARHPLDTFVSLCHHRKKISRLGAPQTGGPPPDGPHPDGPPPDGPHPDGPHPDGSHLGGPHLDSPPPGAHLRPGRLPPPADRPVPLRSHLLRWIAEDSDPREYPDSLPGLLWHLSDAWARRGEPNVLMMHYDELSSDLDGQMRRIASQLGITVPAAAWPALVQAATFERMRASADQIIPTANGGFQTSAAFFHRGVSGAGRGMLSDAELAGYYERAARLAPPDLLEWLHSPART
jgi:aryl sulfotransferase